MKTNLLKSIFISLLTLSSALVDAATVRIYCKNAQSWWKADNAAVGAYAWKSSNTNTKNANWPGVRMTKVDGETDMWYIDIDNSIYDRIIFTRVNSSGTIADWGAKTGDLTISTSSNLYTITQSTGVWEGATSAGTWGQYKPTSTGKLTASATTVNISENVTLTPSLTSNTNINTIKSTSYSISPTSGASTSGNIFTATAAGTYTVTATITYHPNGYSSLTSTVIATTTVTVTNPTYTVTFNANGHGTAPTAQTVSQGSKAKQPTAPTATGYTFGGWYREAGCTNAFDFNTAINANITLYAKWTANTNTAYVVKHCKEDLNGNYPAELTETENLTGTTDSKVTPSVKSYEGFTAPSTQTVTIKADGSLDVTYKYTRNSYQLTWNLDGGTITTAGTAAGQVKYEASLSVPTVTKEGHNFTSWDPIVPSTMPASDATYTAQWEKNTYIVTYGVVGAKYGTIALNGENPIKDSNKQDLEHGAALTFTATPADGYRVKEPQGWYSDEAGNTSLGNGTAKTYTINSLTDQATVFVRFEEIPASTYIVTFDANGGSGTMNSQSFTENVPQNLAVNEFTRKGYTFTSWNTAADGTGASYPDRQSVTLTTAGLTLYAQWTANTTNVTLGQEGANTPGTESVDATYDAAMPSITCPIKNGYAFMGYWDAAEGGKKYYNEDGTSAANWDKDVDNLTLFAHFQKAQIATLTLDRTQIDAGDKGYVTPSYTIAPTPAGTVVVTWQLQYSNGNPVNGHEPIIDGEMVKFSVDGLAAGAYQVVATLHLGDSNGEVLHTQEVGFVMVGAYTVTVKYMFGSEEIAARTTHTGHPTNANSITAPEIGGYNFVKWVLGDGITSESTLTEKTITYLANYDGYLTATYDKKKLVFLDLSTLPNKSAWTAPHVYLYKDNSYWDDTKGVGAKNSPCVAKAAMVQVPNTTDMWFYEYEGVNTFNGFVAFTATNKMDQEYFWDTEVIYRGDFSMGTPVFVPAQGQAAVSRNSSGGKDAKYYSKGHWTKYMGGTGYTLKIYNHKEEEGRKELMSVPFTGSSLRLPFTAVANLETNQTYGYKIVRDNEKWYKNDADNTMTTDNHKNWPFIEDNSNGLPCGLQTVAAGDYTFTLTLNATSGNLEVSVDYPVTVGYYRVLYKDNTRSTYKPSQIIKADETNPIVGYFVRPGNNPELKVQTAARVTGEGVTWTTTENEIFFKPNANWKSDGARFAAYFYNASYNKWVDLKANGDLYSCAKPTDKEYTHVIFCRMDPKISANNFNKGSGNPLWNQSVNIALINGKNLYALEEGSWRGQIYLKPNSNWTQQSARFAARFYNDNGGEEWKSMSDDDGDGVYSCDIPDYPKVIFVRMNPNGTDNANNGNNWNNKWNQTGDLTIPTDGKDLFTITSGSWEAGSWSNSGKSWSKLDGGITDLTSSLTAKLTELETPTDAVYTIYLSANGTSIEKVEPYTGNYYIRVDAAEGKWYDYKTNPDNLMTYSAFSENEVAVVDGEATYKSPYSHYKTAWCTEGQNVKFVIANDYSPCISDTLVQDSQFNNIDEHGNLKSDNGKYNANIRFMWNRKNNKVSRAYLAAATDKSREFLVLKSNSTLKDAEGNDIANNKVLFDDTQNWIYETTVKVQPGTYIKLYACYPTTAEADALYFRGEYASNSWDNANTSELLGGSGSTWYTVRVIYDFKTNRLMTAWIPDNEDINGTLAINADVMVTRSHHDDARCITFANKESSLTEIKTVYGTLQFNRWILNNRANPQDLTVESCTKQDGNQRVFDETTTNEHHAPLSPAEQKSLYERGLYFVSFPFDVHLSDVFGFGTYGTHWVISAYNGKRRAERGYFIDNCVNDDCSNWDYIWDPDEFVMNANEGYLLSLDLDLMRYDNTNFWSNNCATVELYFPSTANVQTIKQVDYTMAGLSEDYQCKINLNVNGDNPIADRRIKDSYWRCIGVPSFADYNGANLQWTAFENVPFIYEWNTTDNSLVPRDTKDFEFRATYAYLVQNGAEIAWSAVNAKPNQIIAKQPAADANYDWKITIQYQDEVADHTYIRMTNNENVTNEFDFNHDLVKEFNYGRADIYTMIGYEAVAANNMPLETTTATTIPLGIDIEKAGEYTIALPEGVSTVGVTLIDIETGKRTNLSAGMEYTVYLAKGKHDERFIIEISPVNNAPTDLEQTLGTDLNANGVQKFIIDGCLYLKKDGILYDAQGHVVR